MKKQPTQKDQRFKYLGNIFTVKCFHGASGKEFDSLIEARNANPTGSITVITKETGGGAYLEGCELIE